MFASLTPLMVKDNIKLYLNHQNDSYHNYHQLFTVLQFSCSAV
jgi:hypothetical protein